MRTIIRKIVKKVGQNIADNLVEKVKNASSDAEVQNLMNIGLMLDSYCKHRWGIELE